jgi:pimeloyl-ACP methyl ester carboxylesterase
MTMTNHERDSASDPSFRLVRAADGRALACCEVGDPKGPLVLHNHGGPSSRLEARLFDAAARTHGLRFVCVDRPGIGRSDPEADRSYEGWARDLVAVADALGHATFGVTGWSEGGPWALAAAAYIPAARLAHCANVAGGCYGAFGDNWASDRLSKADRLGGFLALHMEPGFKLMYAAIGLTATHFGPTYMKSLEKSVGASDRAVVSRPDVEGPFLAASAECFAQGSEGLVRDAMLLYRKWPFDVAAITRPVHVWQGTADTLVEPFINRTIAERMPGAVWHPVEGAGHFVAVAEADAILAAAAKDLALVERLR